MTEDIRNDFLLFKKLKDNPVHNCVDLSKRMIGTRDGFVYYTQSFRIDFENKMASLAAKDTEINKLNNVIEEQKKQIEARDNQIKILLNKQDEEYTEW